MLRTLTFAQAQERLVRVLSPSRYAHSLRVMAVARDMALAFGVDVQLIRHGALLHDCAKGMPLINMQQVAHNAGVKLDPLTLSSTALLHAPAGVVLAQGVYGVTDPRVMSGIRWHTTGRPGMTDLEKIIYLADMVEPGRRDFPGMGAIRAACQSDLDLAMGLALEASVRYILKRGQVCHPNTTEALAYYRP